MLHLSFSAWCTVFHMSPEVTVWSNAMPCFIVVQNTLCLVWAIEQLDTSCEGTSPRLSKPQQCALSQRGYASDEHYASYLFSEWARVFMSQGAKVWPWLTSERGESYRKRQGHYALCVCVCVCVQSVPVFLAEPCSWKLMHSLKFTSQSAVMLNQWTYIFWCAHLDTASVLFPGVLQQTPWSRQLIRGSSSLSLWHYTDLQLSPLHSQSHLAYSATSMLLLMVRIILSYPISSFLYWCP